MEENAQGRRDLSDKKFVKTDVISCIHMFPLHSIRTCGSITAQQNYANQDQYALQL
jgi:hypothetical protein